MDVLLTNDDGIDEPGLRALYESLSSIADVRVIAPASNQSAVGRSLSYGRGGHGSELESGGLNFVDGEFSSSIPHVDHELGYAVNGTPCDCVILGIHAFDDPPDVVVAGCNAGANLGAFVLGRSGTASAAMEAAYLGVPGVAVSMDTLGYTDGLTVDAFSRTATLTTELIEHVDETDCFEHVDYINVNTPTPDTPIDTIELTRPSPVYEMDAALTDGRFTLRNRLWEQMHTGDLPDPPGTDRRALSNGNASISALGVPIEPRSHDALEAFVNQRSRA